MNITSKALRIENEIKYSQSVYVIINKSSKASWDEFVCKCSASYRCFYHAGAFLYGNYINLRGLSRYEFFIKTDNIDVKIGQCALVQTVDCLIFCDEIQLLPEWRHLLSVVFSTLLHVVGPGRYRYGSEWMIGPPIEQYIDPTLNLKIERISPAFLEAINFSDYATWEQYYKSMSKNVQRNYERSQKTQQNTHYYHSIHNPAYWDIWQMLTLKAAVLHEKGVIKYKIMVLLKTIYRQLALKKHFSYFYRVGPSNEIDSFATCIVSGQNTFYIEGGSSRDAQGTGWFVLVSAIREAYERCGGKGLFVMGPVDADTRNSNSWAGLAHSRQQCRVISRNVAVTTFSYGYPQMHKNIFSVASKFLTFTFRIAKKDPRLIYKNVTDRILFDILHRVDTVRQIPKDEYLNSPDNLPHGLHYSSSWTSEIKFGFKTAQKFLKDDFDQYTFIDIGCGKGKVQLVWELLLQKFGINQKTYGIDYYNEVLIVAQKNYKKIFNKNGLFIQADATEFKFGDDNRIIIYMYNPFDAKILTAMLCNLIGRDVFLIYNNPAHEREVLEAGFIPVVRKGGFHPQAVTATYFRRAPMQSHA